MLFRWALQHGVIEGMAVLLQQKGCGWYASLNAAGIVSVYVFSIFWFFFYFFYGGSDSLFAQLGLDAFLLVFYGSLWLLPSQRLFRRPALIVYAKIWFLIRVLGVLLHISLLLPHDISTWPECGYYFFRVILFSLIQPLISYHVMYLDSLWWQGIDVGDSTERPSNVSSLSGDITDRPSLYSRRDFSLYNAQAVASVMDRIGIEQNVRMLNFAYLRVRKAQPLGKGSFSTVYRGTYKRQVVAVKRIDTADLTITVIHRVASEASILSSIQNINVVGIYGVVLMPPSIYIVLELCKYGSLGDIIRPNMSSGTPPLHLSTSDEIWLALGCARGINAVHSFSSTLCHRDVKSFNFLVDCQFNVKIADLELGDAKGDIKRDQIIPNPFSRCPCLQRRTHDIQSYSLDREKSILTTSLLSNSNMGLDLVHPDARDIQPMWLAPEVLRTGRWCQASDIYSLGIVLWELRSRRYPFEDCRFNVDVQREILSGYRHPFPTCPLDSVNSQCYAEMEELITKCWDEKAKQRPNSVEIVSIIEKILYKCCLQASGSLTETAVSELNRCSTSALQASQSRPITLSKWFINHSGPWAMVEPTGPYNIRFKSDAWITSMQNIYSIASSPSSRLILPEFKSLPVSFADAGFYIPSVDAPGDVLLGSQARSTFIHQFTLFMDSILRYRHGHVMLSNETNSASHLNTSVEFSLHAFVIEMSHLGEDEMDADNNNSSADGSACLPSSSSGDQPNGIPTNQKEKSASHVVIAVIATDILELRREYKHTPTNPLFRPAQIVSPSSSERLSVMEIKPEMSNESVSSKAGPWKINAEV